MVDRKYRKPLICTYYLNMHLFFSVTIYSQASLPYFFENVLLKQGNQLFFSCQILAFDLPSSFAKDDHTFLKHSLSFYSKTDLYMIPCASGQNERNYGCCSSCYYYCCFYLVVNLYSLLTLYHNYPKEVSIILLILQLRRKYVQNLINLLKFWYQSKICPGKC